VGMHFILVANRASNQNISAEVKANVPNRVVFAVTSKEESKLAGIKGSERLKPGEVQVKMGSSDPKKLTEIFTPDINVNEVVDAVKNSISSA
jgi:DNA segregation ATPase FtsK/SpoIIIE-like protein